MESIREIRDRMEKLAKEHAQLEKELRVLRNACQHEEGETANGYQYCKLCGIALKWA